jgi:hypothetical protein
MDQTPERAAAAAQKRNAAYFVHILETYGLTREMYERIVLAQQGRCAGCGCQPRKQRLGVDHSHALEKLYGKGDPRSVRGLLCAICNHKILGTVHDNPERLKRLVSYLEDPPAPRALGFVLPKIEPEPYVAPPEPEPEYPSFETTLESPK